MGGGVGRECRGPLPDSPPASPRETPWGMAAAMRLVPEPAGREEEAQGGAWSSSQASELVFKILFGGLVSSNSRTGLCSSLLEPPPPLGILCGAELPSARASPALSPGSYAGRGCGDGPRHGAGPRRTGAQCLLSSVWDVM